MTYKMMLDNIGHVEARTRKCKYETETSKQTWKSKRKKIEEQYNFIRRSRIRLHYVIAVIRVLAERCTVSHSEEEREREQEGARGSE